MYRLTHKRTGEFYIGYREANKIPSHLDLPKYKTSSTKVKKLGFENFDWIVIAHFFNGDDAWTFEQQLIAESFKDPLILNRQHRANGRKSFRYSGPRSDDTKSKMSAWQKGRTAKPEEIERITKFNEIGSLSEEHKRKIGDGVRGFKRSDENKRKLREHYSQTWTVIHPDGNTETVVNMKQFCLERGLDNSEMSKVARGKANIHKGFRCTKV